MKGGNLMIISSSNMNMASTRNYSKNVQQNSTTAKWTFSGIRSGTKQVDSYSSSIFYEEKSSYSGTDSYDYFTSQFPTYGKQDDGTTDSSITTHADNVTSTQDNLLGNMYTMKNTFLYLIDMIRNSRFKKMFSGNDSFETLSKSTSAITSSDDILSLTSSTTPTVWNVVTTNSYFMEEKERTTYTSTGTVVTADGRNISFDVTLEMSRAFTESSEFGYLSQYQQILTDPLVMNLDSNPTAISDKTFLFDLDNDGNKEEIAELTSSNGYLALDKNGDGTINNGSELFGTSTGNGFRELAIYDSDHNGWIDEADDVYSQLKVWTKDSNGKDILLSLKDADVGAIYLESSKTQFSLTDDNNSVKGMVRSTGMYLKESGESGTIQQVDL